MSAFHEAIKLILADVNKFLNSTLKDENLSKSSQKERSKILASLQKLYEEFEVLNPCTEDGSSNSSKGISDESRFTTGSTHSSHGSHGSEEDGSDNIPYTTVKALILLGPTKLGYLHKKPTDLLESFSKKKKYCVIHKNILYWFKKSQDKKHQGAIFLTGYEYKDCSQTDRDFVFELSSSKKKCYQFQADTKEDLEDWRKAVESGCKFVEHIKEDVVEEAESGDEYEPIDEMIQAMKRHKAAANKNSTSPISAAVVTELSQKSELPQLPTTPRQLPPPPPSEDAEKGLAAPEEEYADGFSEVIESVSAKAGKNNPPNAITPPAVTSTAAISNSSASIPVVDEFVDEDDNLIYEFVESPPQHPTLSNKTASASALVPDIPPPRPSLVQPSTLPATSSEEPPPLPSRGANIPLPPRVPLPPTPVSASTPPKSPTGQKTICPDLDIDVKLAELLGEDYENLFFGMFTCTADSDNELSFDRGDIIHILNRDLDLDNWWIGESYGKIGLVPKEFLTPAFELVA